MKEKYIHPSNQNDLKHSWDMKNVISTAVKEIIENKKIEIAKRMLKRNTPLKIIAADTGLTLEKIRAIAQSIEP